MDSVPLIYTHTKMVGKEKGGGGLKRERFPQNHLFYIGVVPDPVLQLWNKAVERIYNLLSP